MYINIFFVDTRKTRIKIEPIWKSTKNLNMKLTPPSKHQIFSASEESLMGRGGRIGPIIKTTFKNLSRSWIEKKTIFGRSCVLRRRDYRKHRKIVCIIFRNFVFQGQKVEVIKILKKKSDMDENFSKIFFFLQAQLFWIFNTNSSFLSLKKY